MDGPMYGDIFPGKQASEVIEAKHTQTDGTHQITVDA
jgi:hypothetical protein